MRDFGNLLECGIPMGCGRRNPLKQTMKTLPLPPHLRAVRPALSTAGGSKGLLLPKNMSVESTTDEPEITESKAVLTALSQLPECECSCCGNQIRAGSNRSCNAKTLRRLSKRVNGEISGAVCLPCVKRLKGTKDWAISSGVSVMSYTIKQISSGRIPQNIATIFDDLAVTKETVEENIKKQLKALDRLTAEYSVMQTAWITVRKAYGDYLWASYPERRKRANRAISQQELRVMIFGRNDYRCVICNSGDNLQIDHITPVAGGGGDDLDNLQTLCRSCNCRKGAK